MKVQLEFCFLCEVFVLFRAGTKDCNADDWQFVNIVVIVFLPRRDASKDKTSHLFSTKSLFCVAVCLTAMYCEIYCYI